MVSSVISVSSVHVLVWSGYNFFFLKKIVAEPNWKPIFIKNQQNQAELPTKLTKNSV